MMNDTSHRPRPLQESLKYPAWQKVLRRRTSLAKTASDAPTFVPKINLTTAGNMVEAS